MSSSFTEQFFPILLVIQFRSVINLFNFMGNVWVSIPKSKVIFYFEINKKIFLVEIKLLEYIVRWDDYHIWFFRLLHRSYTIQEKIQRREKKKLKKIWGKTQFTTGFERWLMKNYCKTISFCASKHPNDLLLRFENFSIDIHFMAHRNPFRQADRNEKKTQNKTNHLKQDNDDKMH